jgi:hypothetical protein
MPEKRSRFVIEGPFFSLAVLLISVVAVLAMAHFR